MENMLFVPLLTNCVCRTCLQCKFLDFEKRLVENPFFSSWRALVVLRLQYFYILQGHRGFRSV